MTAEQSSCEAKEQDDKCCTFLAQVLLFSQFRPTWSKSRSR